MQTDNLFFVLWIPILIIWLFIVMANIRTMSRRLDDMEERYRSALRAAKRYATSYRDKDVSPSPSVSPSPTVSLSPSPSEEIPYAPPYIEEKPDIMQNLVRNMMETRAGKLICHYCHMPLDSDSQKLCNHCGAPTINYRE